MENIIYMDNVCNGNEVLYWKEIFGLSFRIKSTYQKYTKEPPSHVELIEKTLRIQSKELI